jgi:RNA polymerase sigma factor (sigma-70 family)
MTDEPADLLVRYLPRIEAIARLLAFRRRLDEGSTEEFRAHLVLRLVENDYAILRMFRGRSSLERYLTIVAARVLNDFLNHQWGKWRASATAHRLGPLAVALEQCLYRDQRPLDEALAVVRGKFPDVADDELRAIVDELPRRERSRLVSIDAAMNVPDDSAEDTLERAGEARRISELIRAFINKLPDDDRVALRLRFAAGHTAPEIARMVHRKPFQIYERIERHLRQLRTELEAAGIQATDIDAVIGDDHLALDFLDTDGPEERHVP